MMKYRKILYLPYIYIYRDPPHIDIIIHFISLIIGNPNLVDKCVYDMDKF